MAELQKDVNFPMNGLSPRLHSPTFFGGGWGGRGQFMSINKFSGQHKVKQLHAVLSAGCKAVMRGHLYPQTSPSFSVKRKDFHQKGELNLNALNHVQKSFSSCWQQKELGDTYMLHKSC